MAFNIPIIPSSLGKDEDEAEPIIDALLADTDEIPEPTKEDLRIAKHVRFNTPKKVTVFQKQNVEYFVGSKAVDTLMESKWAKRSKKADPVFQTRDDAIRFMETLLQNGMFYRADKVLKESKAKKEAEKKSNAVKKVKESEKDDGKSSPKVRKRKKESSDKDKKAEEDVEEKVPKKKEEEKKEKEKKKKKYKLEVHEDQVFRDSADLYVWIYDPLSTRKILLGGLVVLGIIGATLFPLWPPSVRIGIYYLSLCGGAFLGVILGTALLRSVLFAAIYVVTMGKHRLWVLPNLLADVGFFESFQPWYTYEIAEDNKAEAKKKDKDKVSDSEDESDQEKVEASPTNDDDETAQIEEPETLAGESDTDQDDGDGGDDGRQSQVEASSGGSDTNVDEAERDLSSDYEFVPAKPISETAT